MDLGVSDGEMFRAGPRVAVRHAERAGMVVPSVVWGVDTPSRALDARSETQTCGPDNQNLCEKPVNQSSLAVPIGVGVAYVFQTPDAVTWFFFCC